MSVGMRQVAGQEAQEGEYRGRRGCGVDGLAPEVALVSPCDRPLSSGFRRGRDFHSGIRCLEFPQEAQQAVP